jgi:hypothetical protein
VNIEELNKNHLVNTDMLYRVSYGLSSRLVRYKNGIIYLEVMFGNKWYKDYNDTCLEIAQCWKNGHRELEHAIGCKVYIIDARKYPYKKDLYLKSGIASYDAKKGLLFAENHLN